MSMFSRRDFMKSAGAMALAVAAAGMLGGCSEGTKKAVMSDVTVKYQVWSSLFSQYREAGNPGEYDEVISVVKGQKTIKVDQLKNLGKVINNVNSSLKVADNAEEVEIDWTTDPAKPTAYVKLKMPSI